MFAGDVAELADALDLGSSGRKVVQVQLLSSPLENKVFLETLDLGCWGVSTKVSTDAQTASAIASAFCTT